MAAPTLPFLDEFDSLPSLPYTGQGQSAVSLTTDYEISVYTRGGGAVWHQKAVMAPAAAMGRTVAEQKELA